jgi:hypothetical protein
MYRSRRQSCWSSPSVSGDSANRTLRDVAFAAAWLEASAFGSPGSIIRRKTMYGGPFGAEHIAKAEPVVSTRGRSVQLSLVENACKPRFEPDWSARTLFRRAEITGTREGLAALYLVTSPTPSRPPDPQLRQLKIA